MRPYGDSVSILSPSQTELLLILHMPVAVMRDLSAPMGSDVLVKSRECDFRPPVGLDGLVANASVSDARFP